MWRFSGAYSGAPFIGKKARKQRDMTQYIARILILGEDPAQTSHLCSFFAKQDFAAISDSYSVAIEKVIEEEHPDLVFMSTSGDGEQACDLADSLKNDPGTAHIPITVQAMDPSPALRRRCYAIGVDDIVIGPVSDEILLARLRPLVRLTNMYSDLHYRAMTAREFGQDINGVLDQNLETRQYRVLVVGDQGEDQEVVENTLESGYDVTLAENALAAQEKLISDKFDALILFPGRDAEEALNLCIHIRNNHRLFNLPVLMIAEADTFEEPPVPYRNGVSNVLIRPIQPDELQVGILTLVRRQKTRWDIHEALASTLQEGTRDDLTGLYTHDFFNAHLIRRTAESLQWEKHFSLFRFAIENIGGIKENFGEEAGLSVFSQVCGWVTAMIRIEDVASQFDENQIVVLLPGTSEEEARVVASRIASVLLHTEFAVNVGEKEHSVPIGIWLQVGVATLRPGDTASSLFERAEEDFTIP